MLLRHIPPWTRSQEGNTGNWRMASFKNQSITRSLNILDMLPWISNCLLVCVLDLFVRKQWKRRSCSSKRKRKIWPNRFYPDLENLSPSWPWLTSKSFLASNFLFVELRQVPLLVCVRIWEKGLTMALGLSLHSLSPSRFLPSSSEAYANPQNWMSDANRSMTSDEGKCLSAGELWKTALGGVCVSFSKSSVAFLFSADGELVLLPF